MQGLTFDIALDRLVDLLPLLAIALFGTIILEIAVYYFFTKVIKTRFALPYTLVAPAIVALLLFTLYPFVYNIRLAFSDLRLKTISCYVQAEGITNAPCSLGQAALNVDVDIKLDDINVRETPSETSTVAFTLKHGDQVRVMARSKAEGYVAETGIATSEQGRVCNPLDTECIQRQREAEAALETQDERDWWQVERENGDTGWIPDITFFMSAGADIYEESLAGGAVVGAVSSGDQVRLIERQGEMWYQIETDDGTTGWVNAEPRQVNLFVAPSDLPIYDEQSTTSEVIGELVTGQEAEQLRNQPLTWSEIRVGDTTGWVNVELRVTEFYVPSEDVTLFSEASYSSETSATFSSDQTALVVSTQTETWYQVSTLQGDVGWVNVQPETVEAFTILDGQSVRSSPDGEDSEEVGSVESGDLVINLSSTTVGDETWYNIQTDQGVVGWVQEAPDEFTDIIVLPNEANMISELDSAVVVATLLGGTQVEELDDGELTWYELRLDDEDGTEGFTTVPPETINERYFARDEISVYSSFNDTSEVVELIPEDTELEVISTQEASWYQIRTRDGDNLIGWVNAEPSETRTIFSTTEDGSIYADASRLAEAVGEVTSGTVVDVMNEANRYWYHIRFEDEGEEPIYGWVFTEPRQEITTERDIVLYSLAYGWENFKRVFVDEDPATGKIRGWGRLLQTENSTFPRLMRTTLIWTSVNVVFHLIFGMALALTLNRKTLKFKAIYRAIIILPWAIPQVIIALTWRGEFNFQFGFVNTMIVDINSSLQDIGINLGLEPVEWLRSPNPALIAVTFVNIWLGIPFYMITLLGGLQSISDDYYEAASMDGANSFEQFWHITVPLIRPVAVPIVTLDVIWTFNNFNVIYLITRGNPNESTNILVTALYNAAFGANGQFQLGFAAAFSLVIFVVLLLFSVVWVTQSGALKGIYEK